MSAKKAELGEAAALRARAERCRNFAREYASEVGTSLEQLAFELDKQADRIEARPPPAPAAVSGPGL